MGIVQSVHICLTPGKRTNYQSPARKAFCGISLGTQQRKSLADNRKGF